MVPVLQTILASGIFELHSPCMGTVDRLATLIIINTYESRKQGGLPYFSKLIPPPTFVLPTFICSHNTVKRLKMIDEKPGLRPHSEQVATDQKLCGSSPSRVKGETYPTKGPQPGGFDLNNSSAVAYTEPVNPFLASDRPSFNPESEDFSPTILFESLAEVRRFESGRYPAKSFGVAYRNLSVHGYRTSTDYQHTFGNFPVTLFNKTFGWGRKRITILNSFDGLVEQGKMLLVLGRPGSGCSTLLKTIAGEMHSLHIGDKSEITYNGIVHGNGKEHIDW